MPQLLIYRGDALERRVDLTGRDLRLGRGRENDIVLDDPSKAASRIHAELRYENGSYVIIDLNSQNGTWIEGRRVQRAKLEPAVPAVIGPFSLVIEETAPAHGMMAGGQQVAAVPVSAPRVPDTVVGSGAPATPAARSWSAAPPPAGPAAKPVAKTKIPPKPGHAPVQPGLIAAIARLPKAVVFGGFAGLVVLIMLMGQLFAPDDATTQAGASKTPERLQEVQPPAGRTNEEIIAEHLAAGKDMLERDPEGAIRDHFDRVLLIEPSHPETLDLKARAEDRLHQLNAEAAAPVSTIPDPAPTIPGGSAAPVASGPASAPATPASTTRATDARAPTTTAASSPDASPVREKVRAAGYEALKRAQQHDAAGRTADAIQQYEQAMKLLPPDDSNAAVARDRLNALRGGR